VSAPTARDGAPAVTAISPRLIVAVLAFGGLCCALTQSLVIPIQSDLPHLLGTSVSSASWVLTATLLAAGVTMPVSGRLADIHGKKKVLVVSAAILVVGSVLVALSSSLTVVLVGRVLQGIAMGYIPVAISLVREVTPPHMRAGATALVSATMGVGGAIGLPLSAWIAQEFNWHALFWMSGAVGLLVLLLTVVVVPGVHDAHPAHLDIAGTIGLAVGLSSTLIGISKGTEWGWTSGRTVGAIIGGLVVLVVWGWYQLRHDDPLVDLRTTARRPVLFTNLAAVLMGLGMMAQMVVVPQLLEMPEATGYGMGQSLLQTGLWMAPGGLMMMFFAPVSSRLINTIGARLTLSIGGAVITVGYVLSLFLMSEPWQLLIAVCIAMAGVGIGYAAMPTLIMDNTPPAEAASSVGINALMRSLGTTIAGAVMAAVMTSQTMDFGGIDIPSETAFRLCFVVGAVATGLGAVIALLVPKAQGDVKTLDEPDVSLDQEPVPAG
jgi:EmrB/QacA subfamily drug resistance transporter